MHSLEAAMWCVLRHNTYEETVLAAVNLGHDTDTTAAIAGGDTVNPSQLRKNSIKAPETPASKCRHCHIFRSTQNSSRVQYSQSISSPTKNPRLLL